MIKIDHLVKHFGDKKAVNDITFTVEEGEIVAFLGPNGAGKSTTMNILTGYLSSTSGKAEIDGVDILEAPLEAKKKIGFLTSYTTLRVVNSTAKSILLKFARSLRSHTYTKE